MSTLASEYNDQNFKKKLISERWHDENHHSKSVSGYMKNKCTTREGKKKKGDVNPRESQVSNQD